MRGVRGLEGARGGHHEGGRLVHGWRILRGRGARQTGRLGAQDSGV
jgi:hypothetical protein